ncbi:MAG TPA: DMT family transporter, partial [Thermodesulfobacteriota bacterium]
MRPSPTAAAVAAGILVGAAMVATRAVVDQTGPASLAFLRYLIGVACLLPPLLRVPSPRIARRDLVPIGLLGIVQFGVLIALLNWGLRVVPSARAALLFATMPLMTMVLAACLGRERLTVSRTLGVLASLAGVALTLGETAMERGDAPHAFGGEAAVLAAAASGALCSVLYQPYLRRYPALPVSALAMLAAVAFLAGLAALEGFFARLPRFTATGWLAVAFIGASSGAGYYLWLTALAHAPPTSVTVSLA